MDETVIRAGRGDSAAFEQLVGEYEDMVFRVASRHGPADEAETVAQESFLAAWQGLPGLRDPSQFRSWLMGITVRKCRDAWRKVYRNRRVVEEPGAVTNQAEGKILLQEVLQSLSAQDRMVMTLLYLEGFPAHEVARMLGASQIAVKVRAHRIKKKLKRYQ